MIFKKSFIATISLIILIAILPITTRADDTVQVTPELKLPAKVFPNDPTYHVTYDFTAKSPVPLKLQSLPVHFSTISTVDGQALPIPGLTIDSATPSGCEKGLPYQNGLTLGGLSNITGGCKVTYSYKPPAEHETVQGGPYAVYDPTNPVASIIGQPTGAGEINLQVTTNLPATPNGNLVFYHATQQVEDLALKDLDAGYIEIRNNGIGTVRNLALDLSNPDFTSYFDQGLDCLTTKGDPSTKTTVLQPENQPKDRCYVHYKIPGTTVKPQHEAYLQARAVNAKDSIKSLYMVVADQLKGVLAYNVDQSTTDVTLADVQIDKSGTITLKNVGPDKAGPINITVTNRPADVNIDSSGCDGVTLDRNTGHCSITYTTGSTTTASPIVIEATTTNHPASNEPHRLSLNVVPPPNNMRAWGRNYYGQLGIGGGGDQRYPVALSGQFKALQIGQGWYEHMCAVVETTPPSSTGSLYCWGYNYYGQLGIGSTDNKDTPTHVPELNSSVVQVATGRYFSCAITDTGAIYCWGRNSSGQLGIGTYGSAIEDEPVPVLPATGASNADFDQISAGNGYVCAIKSDDTLWCWGNGSTGRLGDNVTRLTKPKETPKASGYSGGYKEVATSYYAHTCAIRDSDGSIDCTGYGYYGQLGTGSQNTLYGLTAIRPPAGDTNTNYAQVTEGYYHTCGLKKTSHKLYCWGYNIYGQVGIGRQSSSAQRNLTPMEVTGLGDFAEVSAGYYHTCARLTDNRLECWGSGSYGALGLGSTSTKYTPTLVGTKATHVAGGYYGTAVIISS